MINTPIVVKSGGGGENALPQDYPDRCALISFRGTGEYDAVIEELRDWYSESVVHRPYMICFNAVVSVSSDFDTSSTSIMTGFASAEFGANGLLVGVSVGVGGDYGDISLNPRTGAVTHDSLVFDYGTYYLMQILW